MKVLCASVRRHDEGRYCVTLEHLVTVQEDAGWLINIITCEENLLALETEKSLHIKWSAVLKEVAGWCAEFL